MVMYSSQLHVDSVHGTFLTAREEQENGRHTDFYFLIRVFGFDNLHIQRC